MKTIRAALITLLVCLAVRVATAQECATDFAGLIQMDCWLAAGPLQDPAGCRGTSANSIAPSFIGCEYPAEGDTFESGYDAALAATAGLTDNGVNTDGGEPIWYAWDDGSVDGDQNFLTGPGGDPGPNQVIWLATWVEYDGDDPIDIQLCVGSDDSTQVWINDRVVFSNLGTCRGRASCQDIAPVILEGPGLYCIRAATWQGGGGWGFSLGLQDELGLPIVSGDPDWIFHGRERPVDFEERIAGGTGCPECVTNVADASCEMGPGGLVVTWTNPPDCDCPEDIELRIDGRIVATADVDATEAVIPEGELPAGLFSVEIANCSGVAASCSPACTDPEGLILGACWLASGPFQNPVGCGGARENFIAPSFIGCEYPAEGEELRRGYDPFLAASSGLTELVGVNSNDLGEPIWYAWDDGTNNGDQDFSSGPLGPLNDQMQWLATWVEYTGDENPVTINLCIGSDDAAQVWINGREAFSNFGVCRGVGTCQDVTAVSLPGPGLYCIRGAAWQGGGGWGLRLGLQDEFGAPILDGENPDWIFHGRRRPEDFEDSVPEGTDCPECAEHVVDAICELGDAGELVVRWATPPDAPDCVCVTEVQIDGEIVAMAEPGETEATIESDLLPGGFFVVDVINCSGLASSCSPSCTDDNGVFLGDCWLATGPYQNPAGCGGSGENFIAPSFIGCEYPAEGDTLALGYDPLLAASSGLTEVLGVNTTEGIVREPIWYAWDDGTLNADQDFSTGPAGPLDNHMQWIATYVEYTGDQDPLNLNLCLGSDDAAQIWINGDEIFNSFGACRGRGGPPDCQDVIPVTLPGAGVYLIRVAAWQGGGGWGVWLGLQDEFGVPIVDGDPDWVFHGRKRPAGFDPEECCSPVRDLLCEESPDGGLDLSWESPEESCGEEIRILVYGEEVARVAPDETSFTVSAADFPFPGTISVDNGGFTTPACSTIPPTEFHTEQGFISSWLYLGPYAQDGGATPGCDRARADYLTDGEIVELEIEPADGDQIDTEFAPDGPAASLGLELADVCLDCNEGDVPTWKAFTAVDGILDELIVDNLVSTGDNLMSYGMFYIDVPVSITVDMGIGSDDTIQVLAAPVGQPLVEIWCNNVGRGTGGANVVQDVIEGVALTPGPWKFMVKVFDGEGGHAWRLRFQDSTGAPLVPGELSLEPGEPVDPQGGLRVPGDCNGDGSVNISDPVCLLGFLFQGNPTALPCGDGAQNHPANVLLMDGNGDGNVNLSDAIYFLTFLFNGGPAHPLAIPGEEQRGCVRIEGCTDTPACPQ